MLRYARVITICLIALQSIVVVTCSSFAASGDTAAQPSDTVFQEIHLSDAGVIAVDTAGYEWHYDFEREVFVLGLPEPDDPPPPDRTNLDGGGQIPIEQRCTEEIWIKPFETRPVTVGYDEFVDADITGLGRVTIKGWVTGDVASLNKRVLVTETGRVDGDVEAPTVVVREGGFVGGRIIERVSPFEIDLKAPFSAAGIIVAASFTVFLLISGLLLLSVAPRQVENVCCCVETGKVKTFFLGFLLWLLLGPAVVLVAITIVGISLVPLAYVLAAVLGMVAFGDMVGRVVGRRFLGGGRSRLFRTLLGILLVMSPWFVSAALLGSSGGAAEGFGVFFLVLAILISAFPVASGAGAAYLTRFGFRSHRDWKEQAKRAPEPPPPAPPPLRQDQVPAPPTGSAPSGDET